MIEFEEYKLRITEEIIRVPEYLENEFPSDYTSRLEEIQLMAQTIKGNIQDQELSDSISEFTDLFIEEFNSLQERDLSYQNAVEILDRIRREYIALIEIFRPIIDSGYKQKFDRPQSPELANTGSNQRRVKLRQILKSCSVAGNHGLYVLGSFDLKKTVHTQQRRAFALANALEEVGALKKDTKVAVVGAGFGGLTFASVAAYYGAKVHLIDKKEELLHYQSKNTQRILHPNLFDWPRRGSLQKKTRLPFLNWSENISKDVAEQVLVEFEKIRASFGGTVELELGSKNHILEINSISDAEFGQQIELASDDPSGGGRFDLCIIAIGFGLEETCRREYGTPLYWDDDNLHQTVGYTENKPEKVLISGTGDGALLDTIRSALIGFQQSQLLEVLPCFKEKSFIDKIQKIEHGAENYFDKFNTPNFLFFQEYKALLEKHYTIEELKAILTPRANLSREVTLNFRQQGVFSLGSSPLNRMVVAALGLTGIIKFKKGLLKSKMIEHPGNDGEFSVFWSSGDRHLSKYNRIIVRHGPDKEYFKNAFPDIWHKHMENWKRLGELEFSSNLPDNLVELRKTKSD